MAKPVSELYKKMSIEAQQLIDEKAAELIEAIRLTHSQETSRLNKSRKKAPE